MRRIETNRASRLACIPVLFFADNTIAFQKQFNSLVTAFVVHKIDKNQARPVNGQILNADTSYSGKTTKNLCERGFSMRLPKSVPPRIIGGLILLFTHLKTMLYGPSRQRRNAYAIHIPNTLIRDRSRRCP